MPINADVHLDFNFDKSLSGYNESAKAYISQLPIESRPDRLIVGVAVTRDDPRKPGLRQLLIVQRAASEKYYPNVFELPGGKVDPEDSTILHAVARELLEETGLSVRRITSFIKSFEYTTSKSMPDGSSQLVIKRSLQLNFMTEVADTSRVVLSPEEHQNYRWVSSMKELQGLDVTEKMADVIDEVFRKMSGKT